MFLFWITKSEIYPYYHVISQKENTLEHLTGIEPLPRPLITGFDYFRDSRASFRLRKRLERFFSICLEPSHDLAKYHVSLNEY